ncbi:hypothetical protein AMTR_s00006p00268820 [Amborella trichopoda]|uniref:Uncharacterized protein n=1 Tax=Amborella trichopoda TaxID=13333 RepID=W1PE66_AMBTC|nr:hypothetical protein AMTR_s00006p00268820 [Amborella trichopoda]
MSLWNYIMSLWGISRDNVVSNPYGVARLRPKRKYKTNPCQPPLLGASKHICDGSSILGELEQSGSLRTIILLTYIGPRQMCTVNDAKAIFTIAG